MNTEMRMERRMLSELRPAEYNPRKALTPEDKEYQDIKHSIEKFGYVDPIIINSDGTVIGGHQRLTVLTDMGYETADVVVVDLDKNDEKALNIALNKITGEWDEVKLKDLLLDLDFNEYDLQNTGFSSGEIENLYIRLEQDVEAEDDVFDLEEELDKIEEPITQRGDVWILGNHRLMCGDSTDPKDVATLLAGDEADLVITDPPYNVAYGEKTEFLSKQGIGQGQDKILNDNMDEDAFYRFIFEAYSRAYEAMRPGAAIYVFHAESSGLTFRQAFVDAGLRFSECLVWEKNSFVLGRSDYQWRHEPCLYGWKEGAGHYFINDRTQDTVLLEEERDLESMKKSDLITYIGQLEEFFKDKTTVLYENKPKRNDVHPTMKPVSLIGRLMKNSSKPQWNVLDLFGGSGSTLMAAEQLSRNAYLMELSEKFCDVIVKRWEEYTGKKAIKEADMNLDIIL